MVVIFIARTKKRKIDQLQFVLDDWGQKFMDASSKEFEEMMRREQERDEEERQERQCRMTLMRALTNSLQTQTQNMYSHTSQQNMYMHAPPQNIYSHTLHQHLQHIPTNTQQTPLYSTTSSAHISTSDNSFYGQLEEE